MDKLKFARTLSNGTVAIANGDSNSSFFDCGGMQLRGILLPANWTPCVITLNVAQYPETDTKFQSYTLCDTTGTIVSIASDASQWLALLPYLTDAPPYIQISCDTPQADDVTVQLILEPIYQGIHG
jgi:hypothetical protein